MSSRTAAASSDVSVVAPADLFAATPGGRLFVRRWTPPSCAHDTPIVLLHDSLGCVELWRDFPAHLAAATQRRVVAYDRLGFGRSDPHPGTLARGFIEHEARVGVQAVGEALGIDRYIAFGHSVGGGMAVGCAAEHGAACVALVTESAQAFVEDVTLQGIRAAQVGFAQPEKIERLKRLHGDKAHWVLHAWIDTWLDPGYADWTLDDALSRVRSPLLALHGDRDEFGSERHPRRIAQLGGGRAVLLPDCGHVPHREQREVVLGHVVPWLASLRD
jgi:pimeloyl-ACP methyl ester carboxylesterase